MEIGSSSTSQPSSPAFSNKSNSSEVIILDDKKENNSRPSNIDFTVYPNKIESKKKIKKNVSLKRNEKINRIKEIKVSKESSKNNGSIHEIVDDIEKNNQSNSDIIIEIDEDEIPKKNEEFNSFKKIKKRRIKKKSQFINGYTPFIFYEKEKFKTANFKEIKPNEFVRQLSSNWRNMSEKEKEPYVKMALEFKINYISKQQEDNNFISNKRKRKSNKVDISNHHQDMNKYIYNILIPFIEQSYEFFKDKGIIKSK